LRLAALLHNGHGHYGEALAAARQACEHEDVVFYGWALVELVEAAVRDGRPDEAVTALDRLSERTRASGTEWALGIEARCRGLLSDDEAATGETVRKRTVETVDELTAQEAQVARLAAQGRTNPEIAALLFISPRTVEYHLHKVFPKLGISSRRELRRALPGAEDAAVPA
jgi:DNA-binding NarL/FixJ family response regulator